MRQPARSGDPDRRPANNNSARRNVESSKVGLGRGELGWIRKADVLGVIYYRSSVFATTTRFAMQSNAPVC